MNGALLSFLNSLNSGSTSQVDPNSLITFISAGQSNIDGRNPLVDAPYWLNQSNPELTKVKMWDVDRNQFNNFKIGYNTGADWNANVNWAFDMVFYKFYSDYINKTIYVVKRSKGGTPIFIDPANVKGSWNTDFDSIPEGIPKLTQELEYRFIDAKSYANSVNKNLNVKAILWYQGGTDVQTTGALAVYKQNFINVINYIRNDIINAPNTPFLFVTQAEYSLTYSTELLQYQTEIQNELSNIYIVDAKDVGMLEDRLHVDAEASEWIGEQAFDQLKDV